jgi:hypothetical protein
MMKTTSPEIVSGINNADSRSKVLDSLGQLRLALLMGIASFAGFVVIVSQGISSDGFMATLAVALLCLAFVSLILGFILSSKVQFDHSA